MTDIDTAYASIVTDLDGRDYILIEGTLISIRGPKNEANNYTNVIGRALRRQRGLTGVVSSASTSASTAQGVYVDEKGDLCLSS